MIRKLLIIVVLGVGGSLTASLLAGGSKAYACGNGVCGYFKDGSDSAWCNVLPDTSIRWGSSWSGYYPNYCWLSYFGGTAHSRLYGVADVNSFINDMNAYLNESSGTVPFIQNSQAGAAFLIDDMLGIDYHNGSTGNGINDARAQFGAWSARIQALGAHQCSLPGQLKCPGTTFGINWTYQPPYFCSSPTTTSAYDPFGAYDTPLYGTAPGTCDHDWRASVPEIAFYWDENGVTKSFHIGSQCGNAQSSANPLPPVDKLPTGSLSITCSQASATFSATFSFSDPDAATTATLTTSTGGWAPSFNSPGPYTQIIPQTQAGPYNSVTVYLNVRDTGPVGDQNYHIVAQANTIVPCVQLGCSVGVTPTPLDPFMQYAITATVTNNANLTPPGMVTLTVTPPGGVVYAWSGNKAVAGGAGGSAQVSFGSVPATGRAGHYVITGTFSSAGPPTPCNGTFDVLNMPYLNVYGGDVAVGASPAYAAGTSTCGMDTFGGVYSWNNHTAGYSGAGAQYAVQALAGVVDFASALSSSNTPPVGLSYANYFSPVDPTKVNPPTGLFGGYFGAITADCDYTSDLTIAPVTTDTTIPATTVPTSTASIKYVSGADVFISGNIIYAGTGGWIDVSTIPSFKLVVVGGDIYIDRNVTQLDGIYVAESSGANGGRIFTCATGLRAPVNLATNGAYTTCNKQLVINGAFVAKYVSFSRTYGTIGQATVGDSLTSNHDAEVFNYTPELWLPRSVSPANNGYTAITGLPPVL